MNSITIPMTAQVPSGFGMPTCGHASDATTGRIVVSGAVSGAVAGVATTGAGERDRGMTLGYTQKSFPGTSAWRPPTS